MKIKIIFYSFSLVLFIALSSWLAVNITHGMLEESQRKENTSDFFMGNMRYKQMGEDGYIHDQLQAVQVTHYPSPDTYRLNSPHLVMQDKDGHSWHISAAQGLSKKGGDEVDLWDNVRVEQKNKNTQVTMVNLITSAATIYPQKKLAHTDQPLDVVQGGTAVSATGATIDFNSSAIKFLSKVKGQYAVDSAKKSKP